MVAKRRQARGLLKQTHGLVSGFNVPNKKPGEPLLEWAQVLLEELPGSDVCVHYSLKHQRGQGDPVEAFKRFCGECAALGVRSVLLVTGPRGPARDAVKILEQLRGQHPVPGWLRLGVAFNACLPTEPERAQERERLVRKLRTGLVEEVWLNTGSDTELLAAGAVFARRAAADEGLRVRLFGSVLLPNEGQLRQMNERPWNGVHFSARYLSSLKGMTECTQEVVAIFRNEEVEPIVESKVRSRDDLNALQELLDAGFALERAPHVASVNQVRRRWSSGAAAVATSASALGRPTEEVTLPSGEANRQTVDAKVLGEAMGLKDLPRTGWVREGVQAPESVAAHSWGVAFLAMQLCPEHLDRGRVLEMCIIHDLAEVRVGDITPDDGIPAEEKRRRETEAMAALGVTERSRRLFEEYEAQETPEARFVKFLDRLDMALQADCYEQRGAGSGGPHDLAKFKSAARALAEEHGLQHVLPE